MKDREDYFTGAQRSQIVWMILLRTPYDVTRPDKVRAIVDFIFLSFILMQVGVVRLINKNVVEACFPLHEGRHDINGPQGEKSDRRVRLKRISDCCVYFYLFSCYSWSGLTGRIFTKFSRSGL